MRIQELLRKKDLTLKQRRWIKVLIATGEPTEAAFQAYDCKDRLVARNIASENMAKLGIQLNDLMEAMGLTLEKDIEDLNRLRNAKKVQSCNLLVKKDADGKMTVNENSNDFIEVDDNATQIKALELSCKLKKFLSDQPIIDQSEHSHITLILAPEENGPQLPLNTKAEQRA